MNHRPDIGSAVSHAGVAKRVWATDSVARTAKLYVGEDYDHTDVPWSDLRAKPRTLLSDSPAVRLAQLETLTSPIIVDGVEHPAILTKEQGRALFDNVDVIEWP